MEFSITFFVLEGMQNHISMWFWCFHRLAVIIISRGLKKLSTPEGKRKISVALKAPKPSNSYKNLKADPVVILFSSSVYLPKYLGIHSSAAVFPVSWSVPDATRSNSSLVPSNQNKLYDRLLRTCFRSVSV